MISRDEIAADDLHNGELAGARLVSVCLLTYNHAHMIEETILSILKQDYSPFEFIISDDCSDDGTWEKISELVKKFPEIRPLCTPRNLGMPGNANFAAAHCMGDYIALLHHDDLYEKSLLTRWAEILDRHSSVTFVCNDYRYDSGKVRGLKLPSNPISGDWFLKNQLLRTWACPVRGTAMVRRSSWIELGGLRERFGLLADVDLWMRLAALGDVGYLEKPLITVRQRRPEGYPQDYGGEGWSWRRHRLLLEIHADNQRRFRRQEKGIPSISWYRFLFRLNVEQVKWISYGLVKRNWKMLVESEAGQTPWDFLPVCVLRSATVWLAKKLVNK